jgi:hypothetical protein
MNTPSGGLSQNAVGMKWTAPASHGYRPMTGNNQSPASGTKPLSGVSKVVVIPKRW